MTKRLSDLLKRWALHEWGTDRDFFLEQTTIEYLARHVFHDYEPSQFDAFEDRLDRWLHNVADEHHQQTLFLLLGRLLFIGRPEFESLCRSAFNQHVIQWLIEQSNIDIRHTQAANTLDDAIKHTWFCPITDSMRINSFLKSNHLIGNSYRPDWRSMAKFGDPQRIRHYLTREKINHIVLLEDFVGTGSQMACAIRFAADICPDVQILAIPLVICPTGDEYAGSLEHSLPNLTYRPVLLISSEMLIRPDPQPDEPPFYQDVRDLLRRVGSTLSPSAYDSISQSYHGYGGTGAVVALYSNCPDNSLPLLHDQSQQMESTISSRPKGLEVRANPFFELYVGDRLSSEEFVEIFSPFLVKYTEALFLPGNVVVKGVQGSGKSMLLSLLKSDVRCRYTQGNGRFPVQRQLCKFIGAGINLAHSNAIDFGYRSISKDPNETALYSLTLSTTGFY